MVLIIARSFDIQNSRAVVSSDRLLRHYPTLLDCDKARVYLNRVYNNNTKKIILTPKESFVIDIFKRNNSWVFLDVSSIVEKHGVPKEYILELNVINLVKQRQESGSEQIKFTERVIFPREFVIECYDSEIEKKIEEETSSIQRISESYHAVALLHQSEQFVIADDFVQGLERFNNDDYDGAIKFFRKVLEGIRELLKNVTLTESSNRNEAVKDIINKGIALLSNFGEHYGTKGLEEEGRLARDITVTLATYVSKYLQERK